MTAPIDTVLYDLGNVLVGWDPYGPYTGRMPRADVDRFFTDVDFATFNHAQDAGRTWAEARAHLATTHPQHLGALDVYVEHFAASLTGPVPGSAALVRELAALGIRLYGLTNWSAELFHAAEPAAPAIGLLRDVLVSGRVGLAKPDPRIFTAAVERFDLDPTRTLFVDDSPANVTAARQVGLHAVHFTTTPAFRTDLRAAGVPVTDPPAA
ncbi:HAD family hydrolase [Oerskovia flava]|uniref:HAD family hydrolase n=1 Tax=Oerskovia flava TaxID=2986422 RepID=UPI00223F97BA|nr:HAD family phosphatase [Oerskovia sp. JB1-3-2]